MRLTFALAIVFAALLAACNGGGTGSSTLPNANPPTGGNLPAHASGSATFSIVIPAASTMKRVRPNYVSPNTQSLAITLTQAGGSPVPSPAPQVVALAQGSPNCSTSDGVTTCTVTSTYPAGSDVWTLALYASTNGTGTPLSINTVAANVTTGNNTVDLTMNPVVASLAFTPASAACPYNAACTNGVVLNALDASGATIIGPGNYVNASQGAVTVSISPAPSGLTLENSSGGAAVTSGTAPGQVTLANIGYDGSSTSSGGTLTVNASDTDGDSASWTLSLAATPEPSATPAGVPSWNGKTISTVFSPTPVVNGTPDAFNPPYGDTPSGGQGPLGSTFDGQTCEASMSNNYHIHVFIGIYVNGSELALPEGLGIPGSGNPPPDYINYGSCFYATHTHDSTGVFHVEYTNPNDVPITQPVFQTQDLFNIWGITVSPTQFGQFAGPVTVYTSGQVYRGGDDCSGTYPPAGTVTGNGTTPASDLSLWTGDPNAIPLYSHEVIWFFVGSGNPTSLPNVSFDEEC
ncbi:MAG TPA: hypothetical protein VMF11_06840 [Candidatus Baltobacteraceae bacterium]|nr:hypothetical protein [Candidatus Baltobacteraceae bacterium]